MSQSFFQLAQGGNQLFGMQSGEQTSPEMKEGALLFARVIQQQADGETRLNISGQSVTVDLQSTVPEGSRLLGRVVKSDQQARVKLLNTLQEFKAIQTRELIDLLNTSPLDRKSSSAESIKQTLLSRGYLPPETQRGTGESRVNTRSEHRRNQVLRPLNPENLRESFQPGETHRATVVETRSDRQAVINIDNRRIPVRTSREVGIRSGEMLELRVGEREDRIQFEILRTERVEISDEDLTKLLGQMGKETDSRAREFARETVRSMMDRSPDSILRRLSFPLADDRTLTDESIPRARDFLQVEENRPQREKALLETIHSSLGIDRGVTDENLQNAREIKQSLTPQSPEEFIKQYQQRLFPETTSPSLFSKTVQQQARQVINTYQQVETRASTPELFSRLQQSIEEFLQSMNRDESEPSQRQVHQYLSENETIRPNQLLEFVRDRVPLNDSLNRPQLNELVHNILSKLHPDKGTISAGQRGFSESLSAEKMIRELGRRVTDENTELVKNVLNEDSSPSRKLLDQLLSNQSALRDSEGEIDQNRLKKAISLLKKGVPVNDQLMRDLRRDVSLDQLRQIWQSTPELPRLRPDSGNLPRQIRQVLQSMGFDLEARLQDDPEQALQSLRSVLSSILGSADGESTTSMDLSRQDANAIFNQIIQHSLSSRSEEGTLYLFIPFQEGDESRMMRVRFEDEREDSGEQRDNQWGVTVEVRLSQLGEMRIHVRRKHDHLGIRIQSEQSSTARLIRERRDQLESDLGRLGYRSRIRVERLQDEFSDWPSRELYEGTDEGLGRLDFTV